MKLLRYLFWITYYSLQPPPKDLAACLKRGERTWSPWRKFRPSVHYNDGGRFWQIWLANDPSYTITCKTLDVALHISEETGEVVGFDVSDRSLKRPDNRRLDNIT